MAQSFSDNIDKESPSFGLQPPRPFEVSPFKDEGKNSSFGRRTSSIKGEEKNFLSPMRESEEFLSEQSELRNSSEGNKNSLRKWAKELRSQLNMQEISKILVKKVQQLNEYKSAKNIMIFYPLKDEIDLLSLLDDKSKNFYLPRIEGENLLCCSYKKGDELCESYFKTKEPLSTPSAPELLDLVIIPALAVDKNNYRLGYGGGFYDRFLKNLPQKTKKNVCIPKQFFIDNIHPQGFDIPIDIIITD